MTRTFIAEPVIGVFSGCSVKDVESLTAALIAGKPYNEWGKLAKCVQSLDVVWPVLEMLADELEDEPELSRAVGELFMFSLHADCRGWQKASPSHW